MNMLERKLVDKVMHYHDAAPVFRIEPRALGDMETAAESLAKHVAGDEKNAKLVASSARLRQGEGRAASWLSCLTAGTLN